MIRTTAELTPAASGRSHLRGFTLIETVICIVITAVMLAAALSASSASRVAVFKITERQRGELLAQQLMSEIMARSYQEPDDEPDFGIEGAELETSRADWDDVDDYCKWSATPPQYKDGSEIPDLKGWGRQVEVNWVSQANLNQIGATETGVKMITVTVTHNGVPVGTLTALRTIDAQ
ncbi:MAG: prepilin-type N-terminal cleavage/methylation domain-containing protein [Phycisphaerales bacterium]|nr:MAG: prepilin-type N-terminal cleavage/methylation domain-containing protein [Phycisphaerales bacterium]